MILELTAQGKLEVIERKPDIVKIHTFGSIVLQTKTNILLTNISAICSIIDALTKLNRSKEIGSYICTFQRINLLTAVC